MPQAVSRLTEPPSRAGGLRPAATPGPLAASRRRDARPPLALVLALAVACLTLPGAARSQVGEADGLEPLLECVSRNLPPESSSQHFHFASRDRTGGGREVEGRFTWKRFGEGKAKALLRVHSPADLKGAGLLLVEKQPESDMFLYLPDLQKVRRLNSRTLSGRLFGSDFTYEDFRQLQGMSDDGTRQRLPDTEIDGVPVHVIEYQPAPDSGSAYQRVVSYIERERCIPIKSEMYEVGGRMRKVLTVDRETIFDQGGVRFPASLLMRDLLSESSTRLELKDIELERKISRKLFSVASLERPRVD